MLKLFLPFFFFHLFSLFLIITSGLVEFPDTTVCFLELKDQLLAINRALFPADLPG